MSIQEHLNKIRNAIYGREVRESIAKGIETAYDDASENGNANMEVKIARGTHPNLRSRLEEVDNKQQQTTAQLAQKPNKGNVSVNDINKNLGKFDETYMTDEFIQQMTGNTPIHSVPADNSITRAKLANKSVDPNITTFLSYGKNLANKEWFTPNYSLNQAGSPVAHSSYHLTEYIPIKQGETYALSLSSNYVLYDLDKQPIELSYVQTSQQPHTFTSTVNGFIRVTVPNAQIHSFQIELGSVQTPFEKFHFKLKYLSTDGGLVEAKSLTAGSMRNNTITPDVTNFIKRGKNLFNKNKASINNVLNHGELTSNSNYFVTDYILLNKGESYTINKSRNHAFYDSNLQYIPPSQDNSNSTLEPITLSPDKDIYIRVSGRMEHLNVFQIEEGETVTPYERYKVTIPELELPETERDNILQGKNLINFGDSIAEGRMSTDYFGYSKQIANLYHMNEHNYALGGYTIADGEHQILSQVNKAILDDVSPDYILLNGMTNDIRSNENTPLGEYVIDDYSGIYDTTTFTGALEETIRTIRLNWLDAKLIYVIPHRMSSRNISLQETFTKRIREVCGKWSVPVVDIYNEGSLNAHLSEMRNLYTDEDGTHPNALGYEKYYVPPISSKMIEISS